MEFLSGKLATGIGLLFMDTFIARCNKARFSLKLATLRGSSAPPAGWLEILRNSRRTDGNF